ncbi:helix-turn-helix transcriptional regulator [Sinorhizobium chiapasense]|uniref:Helix-turn-helix transcriptional regulator n=1 Tax=Sinorhizobium chiapasense TaxID=501572 RepID=A0ABZ2BJV0_9HYPH
MDSISEIMRVLRAGRALAGLSQEELAELSGVSRQIVVRIEKGENNVLVDAIDKVRRALEERGVTFTDATRWHGPGVAVSREIRGIEDADEGPGGR